MSFFKDFKEDLSQAVNEMIPGEDSEGIANELDDKLPDGQKDPKNGLDINDELGKLNELLGEVKNAPASSGLKPEEKKAIKKEESKAAFEKEINALNQAVKPSISDEVAIITTGMTLSGNLESTGSIEVQGLINGDVQCNGKLVVTGTINGNTTSAEFFADAARVEGEIQAAGTVKLGSGSVVVGNITATGAVIAGAIKGDIDVRGPVVVDTSAVVMGNIKSKSVQINNGAVIEGFCSQCYADIDVKDIFG